MRRICLVLTISLAATGGMPVTWADTILVEDRVVEITQTLADPTDLWVSPTDLTKLNGFVLKPEGACLDEICVTWDSRHESS